MKLSVLIPMYNVERYIKKCLTSLLNQGIDILDYEIIVVNDGSTDNSLEIAKTLSQKHTNIVVYSQENKGTVFTRNRMLKLAKGEYIYFVDADDYVASNALNVILNFATSNQLDLVGFDTLVTKSREKNKLDKSFVTNMLPEIVIGTEYLKDNKNLRIEIWWYFVRKDFLEKHNIHFDRIDYDGDVVFTLKLFLKAKRVAYFPFKIYRYFQSPKSTIRGGNSKSKKRIIDYFIALIIDFSNLINIVEEKEIPLPTLSKEEDVLPILQQLPPAYKMVFNLSVMEGYKHEEIAQMLGITASASRSNLTRAKEKLRALMQKKNSRKLIMS